MDALDTVPVEAPADALLDFAASLQRSLRGVGDNDKVAQLNAELAQTFDGFAIWQEDDAIRIEPLLHWRWLGRCSTGTRRARFGLVALAGRRGLGAAAAALAH